MKNGKPACPKKSFSGTDGRISSFSIFLSDFLPVSGSITVSLMVFLQIYCPGLFGSGLQTREDEEECAPYLIKGFPEPSPPPPNLISSYF